MPNRQPTASLPAGLLDVILPPILRLMERHRPAGELVAGLAVGGVDEEAIGLDEIGLLLGVEGDEVEATAFLVGCWR